MALNWQRSFKGPHFEMKFVHRSVGDERGARGVNLSQGVLGSHELNAGEGCHCADVKKG